MVREEGIMVRGEIGVASREWGGEGVVREWW